MESSEEEEEEQSPPKKKTAAVRSRPSATKEKVKKRKDDEDFEMESPAGSEHDNEKPNKQEAKSSTTVKAAKMSVKGEQPVGNNPPKKFECV